METALRGFSRLRRRRKRPGFWLPTGLALALLALAAVPIGGAGGPDPSDSSDKSLPASQFLAAYNSMATADWLNEKGMQAEASDIYTEALNLFRKISADYPQWQPAVVAFRVNYCRAALQNLRKAGGGQNTDSRHQMPDQGKTRDRGRTPGGEKSETGSQQSEISDRSPLSLKLQQAAFKERGRDYTGALAIYRALLEEFPRQPDALKGACRCCLRLGRMDQARALAREGMTLPLPDADLNLLAALVDCYDGRYQAATPRLRQSLKQNGACPEAHVALGVALMDSGKIKEAQEEMKRALSFNPKLGDAYYNLARLSLWQKPRDHDTPRVHYQNALRHGAAPDPELDALLIR